MDRGDLHVDALVAVLPFTLDGTPGAAGQGAADFPHVVGPGEIGTSYSMQAFCVDAAAPNLLSATNGLWFEYGP